MLITCRYQPHWNRNVVILTKFSSLAAPEVVILTTSGAASDENLVKMIFPFQGISQPLIQLGRMHYQHWRSMLWDRSCYTLHSFFDSLFVEKMTMVKCGTKSREVYTSKIKNTGLILDLHPANERRRYKVIPSLIGWAQTWNLPRNISGTHFTNDFFHHNLRSTEMWFCYIPNSCKVINRKICISHGSCVFETNCNGVITGNGIAVKRNFPSEFEGWLKLC